MDDNGRARVRLIFQSTPPTRGATGQRPGLIARLLISIHAPHEGGDVSAKKSPPHNINFNPRPPRGGRPCRRPWTGAETRNFNPRPPRGGRPCAYRVVELLDDFNPRPPRGGRRAAAADYRAWVWISIHAPHEGGDGGKVIGEFTCDISIHAPHEGGDLTNTRYLTRCAYFNPRPPRGGRH